MEAVNLFLNINKPGLNNEWNTGITTSLKELPSMEEVMVIEQNESSNAQINISYDIQKVTLDEIELLFKKSGATITDINIHFPSGISGTSDPYGSSAISITLEENLKSIVGVLGSGISANGIIKVSLTPDLENKQTAIDKIFKTISSLR